MEDQIMEVMDSPGGMETLYRQDSTGFTRSFPLVYANHPESVILQVWYERLSADLELAGKKIASAWTLKNLLLVIALAAVAGTMVKLPQISSFIDYDCYAQYYVSNLGLFFIVPLMIYFIQRNRAYKLGALVLVLSTCGLVYLNLLPSEEYCIYSHESINRAFSDALDSARMHVPLMLILLTGVAFTGREWRSNPARMGFLRYLGELIVFTTILVIAVMLLTGITSLLLGFIDDSYEIQNWYFDNAMVYLLVSTPVFATFLIDRVLDRRQNIAPAVARIFAPLFLLTIVAYFIVMLVTHENPFGDRDYLIALNVLMIVVLGLLIFTISERDASAPVGVSDTVNLGLALAVAVLDGLALAAIITRTAGDVYGLTPNRITILGVNLIVFVHIIGILVQSVRFNFFKKPFEQLTNWISGYLPVYLVWAVLAAVGLPVLFWYK